MEKKFAEKQIWIVTPFERPDVRLFRAAAKAGALPVLHLGRDRIAAEAALSGLASMEEPFGVCLTNETPWEMTGEWCKTYLSQVSKIILPWDMKPPEALNAEIVRQVKTAGEAEKALAAKAKSLIIKGCESAGLCGEDSSFMLFQKLIPACKQAGASVFVQGGVGAHTAPAYIALGAAGVILDSQVALFPECGLSKEYKTILGKLTGNEIRSCEGFHYYVSLGSKEPDDIADIFARIAAEESDLLPLGQDVILACDLADTYKKLKNLVRGLKRSFAVRVKQARAKDAFAADGKTLGTVYPVVQGPMARISDVPAFLDSVSEGGALPVFAMGMMTDEAVGPLAQTAAIMGGRPWGAGILGFAWPQTIAEQTKLILENKPSHVLIAGGRPGQTQVFEQAGIKVLLHAPTPSLLDMFLKDGATAFIFEGRESGGHVGPLYSAVLWEKQIARIINSDNPSELSVFFAGGIHDALSAAFVRLMAGPLTARGVKVGLQCGTAYLYAEEAVRHGAITETYQKLMIDKKHTTLLKSVFGQETRCVPSPFVDFFQKEKARMEREGLSSGELMQNLETLNLGRSRIASKGIALVDDELVSLPEDEQIEQGLYMTGAVTELIQKASSIA
ncbi:MAG: nitronate monooxygenase, partial [Clostridiales bacterium]|nr:nitronate monooxygenase [Clostridiales bacterium]